MFANRYLKKGLNQKSLFLFFNCPLSGGQPPLAPLSFYSSHKITRPNRQVLANVNRSEGFTLVEVILVIILVGLLTTVAIRRFDTVYQYRQRGEIRKLINTWELLYQESLARGEAYRLLINLDDQAYTVRREVMQQQDGIRQVDYLKNLRTKNEKERRRQKELEETASIEESLNNEAARESQSLDALFYQALFIDPYSDTNLEAPQEFPSLAQQNFLPPELKIRDIRTEAGVFQEGDAVIRFSPRGGSDFAVIHIEIGITDEKQIITLLLNPWTGKARVINRDMDFEWTMDDNA